MSKCHNCLFLSNYRDMGWSADVCTRGNYNLAEAIEACENPEPCKWHITRRKVMDIQTLDFVPKSEYERIEVELEAMRGAANSYKMHYKNLAREICCKVEEEIVAALESNYKAKSERLKNPHIDTADEFISWCEGKIAALRGIEDFVEELKKKYPEDQGDG